ncbi:813_t:CDS:2, partial [Paraglomus occultum]
IDTLKDKIRTKSKEKKDFLSKMEALKNALASKDDELKQMKDDLALKTSEIHSLESKLLSEPIKIGGEADEKKIPNSISRSDDAITSDIPSKDLSQYFIRGKENYQVLVDLFSIYNMG